MAEHTFEQLKGMTVSRLRQVAQGIKHEALDGYTTMHKQPLLRALSTALNVHEDHAAHVAGKANIRRALRKVLARRDEALAAGKRDQLPLIHRQIHVLKHKLRRMAR